MSIQKSFVEKRLRIINSLVGIGVFVASLTAMLLFPGAVPMLFGLTLFSILLIGPWLAALSGKDFGKNFCVLLAASLIMLAATLIASPLLIVCAVSFALGRFARFASKSIMSELIDATQNTREEKASTLPSCHVFGGQEDKNANELTSEGSHLREEHIQYHMFIQPVNAKHDALTSGQQDLTLAGKVSP